MVVITQGLQGKSSGYQRCIAASLIMDSLNIRIKNINFLGSFTIGIKAVLMDKQILEVCHNLKDRQMGDN